MARRAASHSETPNVFQTLIDASYEDGSKLTPHEITGMLIATVFAGHHTSSGTAAWVLIELLRHPQSMQSVVKELDELFGGDGKITFESLRQIPKLDNVLKEVLRLHPPLIILMRKVMKDFQVKDYTIKAGKFVCAAPAVTHRIPEVSPIPSISTQIAMPQSVPRTRISMVGRLSAAAGTNAQGTPSPCSRSRRSSASCCGVMNLSW